MGSCLLCSNSQVHCLNAQHNGQLATKRYLSVLLFIFSLPNSLELSALYSAIYTCLSTQNWWLLLFNAESILIYRFLASTLATFWIQRRSSVWASSTFFIILEGSSDTSRGILSFKLIGFFLWIRSHGCSLAEPC